ncbi:MAG: HAD-IA family hydrolase [Deltaproteobacteria bacterium]|nr:HAD-IA family hydrolase [Deltaproteobacteria bacterium]
MRVDAVVFDLDGTLVDSLPDIAAALGAALVDHGRPAPALAQVRDWIGGGAQALVEHAVETALVASVLERFRVHYRADPAAHTRIFDGLEPVLDRLAATRKLAILSNKPHDLTTAIAGALLARWPFAAVVGGTAGAPLKPDPTTALAIAARLDVPPGRCALVGDAATDVATARAAGMAAVAVTWGYRPRAELVAANPHLLVDAPAELAALA